MKKPREGLEVLRSRLYEMEMRKQQEAIAKDRRTQVGTGDRSEKIRTYNFRDNRITDTGSGSRCTSSRQRSTATSTT